MLDRCRLRLQLATNGQGCNQHTRLEKLRLKTNKTKKLCRQLLTDDDHSNDSNISNDSDTHDDLDDSDEHVKLDNYDNVDRSTAINDDNGVVENESMNMSNESNHEVQQS